MSIRLRPHHLLCMLTYVGRGYSPAFIANYDQVAGRIAEGEEIIIVAGPDDICAPLLCDADCHCHNESVDARDELAATQVSQLLGQTVAPGSRLPINKANLQKLRDAFLAGHIRSACEGCEWRALCDDVAASGYENTVISTG